MKKLKKEKISRTSLYANVSIERGDSSQTIGGRKGYNTVWREVQRDIKDAERVLEYVQKGQFSISKPKPKTKKKVKKK
jgi:hypothetical protein